MNSFLVDEIATDAQLRLENGILRCRDLQLTTDARVVAQRIRQQAQEDAEAIRRTAQDEAQRCVREAEQEVMRKAADLLLQLEQTHARLIGRAQEIVVDLVKQTFDHVVLKSTPRAQIEAALRRVLREAPPRLVHAVLHVHPDAVGLLPELEWEVKPDESLPRGACRLEAANGEWRADFAAAAEAVKAAFATEAERRREAKGREADADGGNAGEDMSEEGS
ncbi:MAG TPA: HrpE/YscL family type III secretion apparatus protein [Noviherbaspirillum sp.]|jgi:flagellar biosynthesis/type III secretory pathway protein FliH|uniref:FliH/SctL family protein n=1 Tax=Noviherbaspirillum sp. TaxID=1926288 RepID=UPI002F941297